MALRNVVLDGDPILKKVCRPVTNFDERLVQLLDDMAETMLEADGLGLAGPQVGMLRRLFVALDEKSLPPHLRPGSKEEAEALEKEAEDFDEDIEWEPVILEFINPEIVEKEGEQRGYEGCLSFPGKFGAVARPEKVKIKAFDRDGNPFEYEATGTMARCLCHETDHLNGVTIDELAEYFYDPEVPHELDKTLAGNREETEAEPETGAEAKEADR